MVSALTFRKLACSFDEAVEQLHFEKPSFRVKKKIFATIDLTKNVAVLKLSEIDQSVFCSFNNAVIYPVRGTWGKQGWTTIELKTVRKDMLTDALTRAYCHVAPKRLAEKYNHN